MNLPFFSIITLFSLGVSFAYAITPGEAIRKSTIDSKKNISLSFLFNPVANDPVVFGVSSSSYTFSATSAGTINYVRLCNSATSSCASCTNPFTIITAGTPLPFSVSGTTYKINPASIASYLTAVGSSSGSYNIGLYVQSSARNCSSSSAYCSTSVDSSASPLCMNATFNGTSVTALVQNDNGVASLSTSATPFAYVANQTASASTSTISKCSVSSNGTLSGCADSGVGAVFSSTQGIAVNSSGTILYVVNGNNTSNSVSKCLINKTNGNLTSCSDSGNTGIAFASPRYITLNNIGTIAYISNVSGSTPVSKCPVNSDGTFGSCSATGNTGLAFNSPRGIAVNSSRTYAYIANSDGNNVSKCPITSNGGFGFCVDSGVGSVGFSSPRGIAINPAGTMAYVTNVTDSTVSMCPINPSTGSFGSCTSTGSGFNTPTAISINFTGTEAYVSNTASIGTAASTVSKCSINASTGALSSCATTGSGFNQPVGNLTTVVPN